MASFPDIPTEIMLMIISNLECARDLCALTLTCKRIRRCVDSSQAWGSFVRSRFPLLSTPSIDGAMEWKDLAQSLTYQTRCWDRRSIRFTAMYPEGQLSRIGLPFQPVVAVEYDLSSREELVVWGAGEDIVARRRKRTSETSPHISWHRQDGAKHGFKPAYDDVKALTIVNLPYVEYPAILAGRASGDLSLLSAEAGKTFGRRIASFNPSHAKGHIDGTNEDSKPEQLTITSLDVGGEGLIAATNNVGVTIYRLPQDNTFNVAPIEIFDIPGHSIWNAKWMGGSELLALALRGPVQPLRYLKMTPTGWVVETAAKNPAIDMEYGPQEGAVFANSLLPISHYPGSKGKTPLLLSSWKDGKCRLQDLRTPSPFDVVYQDNIQPNSELGSLLSYDADRFIGGSMTSTTLKIFDLRWPKSYYHTTALPCSSARPFPPVHQPFIPSPPRDPVPVLSRCDHLSSLPCRWHHLSRELYHRPNATFMLSRSLPPQIHPSARVTSLAAASSVSPTFYAGITGAVIEANLGCVDDPAIYDAQLGFPDYVASNRQQRQGRGEQGAYRSAPLSATMIETGDGLAARDNDGTVPLPTVYSRLRAGERERRWTERVDPVLGKQHRLDKRFWERADFGEDGVKELEDRWARLAVD